MYGPLEIHKSDSEQNECRPIRSKAKKCSKCLNIVLQNVNTYCRICSLIFSAPCRYGTHSTEHILCVHTIAARLVHLEIYNLDPEKKVCYKVHQNREYLQHISCVAAHFMCCSTYLVLQHMSCVATRILCCSTFLVHLNREYARTLPFHIPTKN